MKAIIIFVLCFCSGLVAAQNNPMHQLSGVWTGTGFQPDNNTIWKVEFTYSQKQKEAKINYPGLKCSGILQIVKQNNQQIEFKEKITTGKNLCTDGSQIIITPLNGMYMQVAWFSDKEQAVSAYAILKKEVGFFSGQWSGTAYQENNNTIWQVDLYFDTRTQAAYVTYPELRCGGKWVLNKYDGAQAVFTEYIETGREMCLDGSTITISRLSEDYIQISWNSDKIVDIDAFAVLKKQ